MRWFTAWAVIIALTGCTTLRTIDGTPSELQQFINSGELIKPGDRIRIVTADEKAHRFAITKIEAGLIVGLHGSVPVDQRLAMPADLDTQIRCTSGASQADRLLIFQGVRNRGSSHATSGVCHGWQITGFLRDAE
jgi:hypothetical protein